MPEKDNEVVVLVDQYDYYFSDQLEDAMEATYYLNGDTSDIAVKVVGVKYYDSYQMGVYVYNYNSIIYVTSNLMNKYMKQVNRNYSTGKININNTNYDMYNYPGENFSVVTNSKVPKGYVYVSENISYVCRDYNCKNKDISISVNNLYYSDKIDLKIKEVYNEETVKNLLGIDKNNNGYGSIFVNPDDLDKLYGKDSYQSSVFASKADYVDGVDKELSDLGYNTLQIRKTLNNDGQEIAMVIRIFKLIITVIMIVTMFFISYFVIKLILKSRQVYFSTLRILGATSGGVKRILDVELFTNATLAYICYVGFIMLVKYDYIHVDYIKNLSEYLTLGSYVAMYIILVLMSYLISSRFPRKVFKKSAMKSYREEV